MMFRSMSRRGPMNRIDLTQIERNRQVSETKPVRASYDQYSTPLANIHPDAGFYQVKKDKEGNHYLELEGPYKKTPPNIYGKTGERVLRYWNKFVKATSNIGVLLVGSSGAGKSLESDLLCNVAIKRGELPVLSITGFDVTEETIQFLEQYDDVVLYFDEFSKHVRYNVQELLLSLLTNTNKKYLVIMTENDINTISAYLRSRPGRAWYRRIFDKLELDVIEDYLTQQPKVTEKFKEELLSKYKSAMTFTFDHLQALISEHKDYPEETIDEMLELLNVDIFTKTKKYYLTKLEELVKEEYVPVDFMPIELDTYQVEQDRYQVSVYVKNKEEVSEPGLQGRPSRGMFGMGGQIPGTEVRFNISNLLERDGATLTFKSNNYRVTLVKAEAGEDSNNLKLKMGKM